MNKHKLHNQRSTRRTIRTRAKISGTADRPRLTVARSNAHIHVQLIDDTKHHTLAAASSRDLTAADRKKTKVEQATLVGELVAKRATEGKITAAVFDRGSYRYHGRVKAIAEGARKGGINF